MKFKKLKLFFLTILALLAFSLLSCESKKTEKVEPNEQTPPPGQQQIYRYPTYSDFYIERVSFNSAGHLIAIFSKAVNTEGLKESGTIQPSVSNLEIDVYGNKIVFKGDFEKEIPYNLTLSKNIKDTDGNEIGETPLFQNLYVAKKIPSLAFSDAASILPSLNNKRLNFNSTNIKKVKVEVIKVYLNNVTAFLKNKDLYYRDNLYKEDLGDVVFTKEYELENVTDKTMKNSIDLTGVIDKKGIYYVKLYTTGEENIDYDEYKYGYLDYYDWHDNQRIYAKTEKNIILSDLGILASTDSSKLNIKTININSLEKIGNTKLQFISRKNQILEEGHTNSDGEYKSKVNADEVFYILAKNGEEYNILYLNENEINFSDFDIGGLVETGDFKIFTYTDKGYYRPGDEINVSLIARNKNKVVDENHPFTYTFTSPTGTDKISSALVNESKNGFYSFKIKSDVNDETGAWNLNIKFGGKEINQSIFIEAKAPNRIAIDVEEKSYTLADVGQDKSLNVPISAAYLTGVKAKDNSTYYNVGLFEKEVNTKKYKSFSFSNPTTEFADEQYIEGALDANGKETIKINIPLSAQKSNLDIFINANVLDTNGRYSTETKNIKFINNDFSIGLEKVTKNDGKVAINYIVLDEKNDSLVAGRTLKYKVFNKKYNWWYDRYEEGENYIKNSLDTLVTEEGEVVSSEGIGTINFSNLEDGINFVEFEDKETGVSSGLFVYNYSYGERAKNGMENLNIEIDKESYKIGDVAKVKFSGAVGGKALITIEKDGKILKEYWKTLTQKDNEESISVEKEYFPNVYVNVSVFQKYSSKENDRPLRLFGTVSLMARDAGRELNIVIDSKEEVKPLANYKLKISNKENKKMYFQYYLIDEGILRMTDYKLPKPFEFFYGKQAKLVRSFDNFSDIIEKYSASNIANYLKTGGGDFEPAEARALYMENNLNLQGKEERFKNISIVSEILETDDNGFAEIDIKIPNYFGAMKIFVVGVSDEKFGSMEKKVSIKAPVIVEASAPRVLKVGDKFVMPITLFPIEDNLGKGKITINYEGKEFSEDVNFENKENQKFIFDLSAPNKVGTTKIDVSYTSDKYNFKDTINLNVDTSYPYQYLDKNSVLKAGQEFKIKGKEFNDFISSTLSYDLSLTSYENLGLSKVIEKLLDYPYVCLEQTASKARAMLAIGKLSSNEEELNRARINLNMIIKKLFNNYQLSNGGFAYWPGNNYDIPHTSIYVIEILLDAKKEGYYIPEAMYNNSIRYLKSLIYRADMTSDEKVDVLYLLASVGEPIVPEMNIIFDKYYQSLPLVSKWILLDAYAQIGERDFAIREADKLARKNSEKYSYSSSAYLNSEILKHYTSIYKAREKDLFNNLLSVLKSDNWLSTDTQANIIDALAKTVDDTEKKDLTFSITVDGKAKDLILQNGQFNFEEIKALKNFKEIVIKNTSADNLYVNFLAKGKPVKFAEKDISKNMVITRELLDMNGQKIKPKDLKVGDRITLVLKTNLENIEYLENIALLQILPSGLEVANDNIYNVVRNPEYEDSYNEINVNYVDIRDDRVAFFYNQYGNLGKEIRLNLNVVSAGEYYFPATSAEAMYDDNFRAYLKGFDIKIKN